MTVKKRLSADEAAARLGVKRETLYAYVSRGMLTSERGARFSTFATDEVEALAARSRRGGRAGGLELIIASGLTMIEGDRLYYRGVDVAELVTTPFEEIAEWLWTGAAPTSAVWPDVDLAVPDIGSAVDRLRLAVAIAGATDELRADLSTPGVVAAGRRMLSVMAGAPGGSIAERVAPNIGIVRPGVAEVALVNALLVLLADHELAASTLAARVAASVRADPYSVVSTGLGVIGGALHGAASQPVVRMFEEIGTTDRVARVVGERLGRAERIPGLGHKVYRFDDPRATLLLGMLSAQPPPGWDVVEALMALLRERLPLVINIDFALGAMIWALGLEDSAGETLFAIARTVGWLAHAIEEYAEAPVRFRPRAAYTGPRPT
jgi:citrate synthase